MMSVCHVSVDVSGTEHDVHLYFLEYSLGLELNPGHLTHPN